MINFAVDIEGLEQWQRAVLSMSEWCQRPMIQPGVFDGLLNVYVKHTKEVYRTRGAVIDSPWPPLAESTIARRMSEKGKRTEAARKRARKVQRTSNLASLILRDTLRLQKSVEDPARRDFAKTKRPAKVEFWTRVPYAQYHQTGTRAMGKRSRLSDHKELRGRGGMPARPLYLMTPAFGEDYNLVLRSSLHDFMRTRVNGG